MDHDRIKSTGLVLTILIGFPIVMAGLIVLINVPSITMLSIPEYGDFMMADPSKTRTAQAVVFTGLTLMWVGQILRIYADRKKKRTGAVNGI